MEDFYRLQQLSERAGVSEQVLRREIKRGRLAGYRLGGRIIVFGSDFDAYLEGNRIAPSETKEETLTKDV